MEEMATVLSVEDRLMPDMEEHHHQQHAHHHHHDFINNPPDDWPLPSVPLQQLESSPDFSSVPRTPEQVQLPKRTSSLSSNTSVSSRIRRSSSAATNNSGGHRKRLSLSFPVVVNTAVRHYGQSSTAPGTPVIATPADPNRVSPSDSMTFLTALAAQERKVLELKEELTKAETELTKLKRQWAMHEATRKRLEVLQTETRPLSTDLESGSRSEEASRVNSPTFAEERKARRQAAMANLVGTCSSPNGTRKVTSQRHTRTLSLLSPQRTTYPQPFPQPRDSLDEESSESQAAAATATATTRKPGITRAETFPTPTTRPMSMIESHSSSKRNSQDVLLRTGKQMAEDFREGLWTFIEDLRQATVGDEPTPRPQVNGNGHNLRHNSSLRRQGSKGSLRSVASSTTGGRTHSPSKAGGNDLKDAGEDSWEQGTSSEGRSEFETTEQHTTKSNTPARWSTTSTIFSDLGSSSSTIPSRSSTPRTSTRFALFSL